MRLIRFGPKDKEKPGVELDGIWYDCSAHFLDWNRDFFRQNGLSKLKALLKNDLATLPFVSKRKRLGSPIARPNMIMCIGLNYSDHAEESGMDIPSEPILFMKATHTISGPFDRIAMPPGSEKVDWEVELGIVLKKDVYQLKDKAAAAKAIAGYTVVNDVSERKFQLEMGGQWVKGKSCPGFNPVGPYVVTPDEVSNVMDLGMSLDVNGKRMQTGSTKFMIFDPTHVVWYVSQFMKLEAGDLINTGTPPGVGLGMNPPKYLKSGDVVELSIEGLGKQRQEFY